MSHKYTFTNGNKIDKLLYFLDANFIFCIGKPSPWDTSWGDDVTELNPPTPSPNVIEVVEPILYKRPILATPAVVSQCGDIEFESCGESINTPQKVTLINMETTSLELLRKIVPPYLYLKLEITAADLDFASATSFRMLGLYKDVVFTPPTNQIRYLPSRVQQPGLLHYIDYCTPIQRQENKTTTFEILINI